MKTKISLRLLIILFLLLIGLSYQLMAQGIDTTQTIHANIDMSNDWLHSDSIRVRIIHVGDSSLIIGNNSTVTPPFFNGANFIRCNNTTQPDVLGFLSELNKYFRALPE